MISDDPKTRETGALKPLPAQIDLDGRLHELAPEHERMRLFEPAPAPMDGQTGLDGVE